MDIAMAPPVKRRKLSSTSSWGISLHRDNCTDTSDTSFISQSTNSRTASTLPGKGASQVRTGRPRPVRPAHGGIEDYKVLLPREGTVAIGVDVSLPAAAAITAYVDASTTITYTAPATPTLPSISGATTFSTTSTSNPSTSTPSAAAATASSSNSTSSTITTSSSTESSSSSESRATNSSHSLTASSSRIETRNSTSISSTTSTITSESTGGFYIATLSDGESTTITRLGTAYITTFDDGEVSTIPGYSHYSTSLSIITSTKGQSTAASTSTAVNTGSNATPAGGYAAPASSTPANNTSTDLASSGSNSSGSSAPPAGTIAGGVVGGCAGLAVLLLIAMFFVRWHRRRAQLGHQALPPASSEADQPGDLSRGPGMAERAGLMPLAAAVPALFRHHNRSTEPSASPERGFTRISGRKLPSQWSEGMSSPPSDMPLNPAMASSAGAVSSMSLFRDSQGFDGGDSAGLAASSPTASPTSPASSHGPLRSSTHEMMTMSPGPRRQPTLHAGGPYSFAGRMRSEPGAPTGYQRSDTPSSLDPSRNSRFTEEM